MNIMWLVLQNMLNCGVYLGDVIIASITTLILLSKNCMKYESRKPPHPIKTSHVIRVPLGCSHAFCPKCVHIDLNACYVYTAETCVSTSDRTI